MAQIFIYRADFELTNQVRDYDAAYKYLTEDDMTKYLKDDKRGSSKVKSVRWELLDAISGYIEVQTTEKLTDAESANISDWIGGQNSDGLGEGFEQQGFANYRLDDNQDDEDEDEYGFEDEWIMASFDWRTNDYDLKFIEIQEV